MKSEQVILAAALAIISADAASAQSEGKTLVAVFAHPDDEITIGPVLARYAREGTKVYLIMATNGERGTSNTRIPAGEELAKARAVEAKCSAAALGAEPPILLGFPDGKLGDFLGEGAIMTKLAQRVQEELARLRPDAVITWGPEGATGHPDHRLVGTIVLQLIRNGAQGVPERIFFAAFPPGVLAAATSGQDPPLLLPDPRYFSMRVPVTASDIDAWYRSVRCHQTQFPDALMERLNGAMRSAWNGRVSLAPWMSMAEGADLFK